MHIPDIESEDDEVEEYIDTLRSAGKLTSILEQDDPDWQEVDKAIQEHVFLLQQRTENESKETSYDPLMFSKTWLEGGYLPITSIRAMETNAEESEAKSAASNNDASCLVVRTKINDRHHNTALIDEGANRSVLNIDWYEGQGIDWRTEFNVPQSTPPNMAFMADQHPVESYGNVTVQVEIKGTKKVKFQQSFCLLRLGKNNYAQILGFDWKLQFKTVTYLPEYVIKLRELGCEVNAHPVHVKL